MDSGYVYGLGTPWGGQDITYFVKIQIGLYKSTKDQREQYPAEQERLRRIERHRYPLMEKKLVLVNLAKDTGYVDLPATEGARPA